MWQTQAAPAAHKCSSDPGMKREWKVKLAWHKGTANCLKNICIINGQKTSPQTIKVGKEIEKCLAFTIKIATLLKHCCDGNLVQRKTDLTAWLNKALV